MSSFRSHRSTPEPMAARRRKQTGIRRPIIPGGLLTNTESKLQLRPWALPAALTPHDICLWRIRYLESKLRFAHQHLSRGGEVAARKLVAGNSMAGLFFPKSVGKTCCIGLVTFTLLHLTAVRCLCGVALQPFLQECGSRLCWPNQPRQLVSCLSRRQLKDFFFYPNATGIAHRGCVAHLHPLCFFPGD